MTVIITEYYITKSSLRNPPSYLAAKNGISEWRSAYSLSETQNSSEMGSKSCTAETRILNYLRRTGVTLTAYKFSTWPALSITTIKLRLVGQPVVTQCKECQQRIDIGKSGPVFHLTGNEQHDYISNCECRRMEMNHFLRCTRSK